MKKYTLFALSLLLISAFSYAEVECKGTISKLGLQLNNGMLILGLQGGPIAAELCSIDTAHNGVTQDTCKALYSTLLATKAAGKKAAIRFYDHNSCTTEELSWKKAGTLGWSSHFIED